MVFSKDLINWYSGNKRDLPWRQTKDPYHIWLSEIILQQTQVAQGLPYYESFLNAFPSIFYLAKAPESQILKLWQGLGYYSRARNLHATAKYIVNELKGEFPNTYPELIKLKGVGDYTASAIASICFNEPTAVVDGNVYRVLARYFGITTPINSSNGTKEFKLLAQQLMDKNNPSEFNQAIMEFGAVQCRPRKPQCDICCFQENCVAHQTNRISQLPVKIKAAPAKQRHFNFLVMLSNDNKTVLEKRNGKGIWQNLYQFPLIETPNENDYDTFLPVVHEHPLLKNIPFQLSLYNKDTLIHKLSHQHLHTRFWIVKLNSSLVNGVPFSEVHHYPVPIVIGNFIELFNF